MMKTTNKTTITLKPHDTIWILDIIKKFNVKNEYEEHI